LEIHEEAKEFDKIPIKAPPFDRNRRATRLLTRDSRFPAPKTPSAGPPSGDPAA
jgi:hypothetical protein